MVAAFNRGRMVLAQSGCQACHKVGEDGNDGPGPPLTNIGSRLPAQAIARTLVNPTSPMPSFAKLKQRSPKQFDDLVTFLSQLK
jgi:mono/diheme cytochrome c family protein